MVSTPPRLAALLLLVQLAAGQIRILAPPTLIQDFSTSRGRIFGSTSTFGAPFYGDRVLGRLVYGKPREAHHCTEADYDIPRPSEYTPAGKAYQKVRLINIVLVERGDCSFVTKVRIAQKKEAHAVIIVDSEGSSRTSKDIQNIIVADDGYGTNIDIPSVLISREEGQKLINPLRENPNAQVIVELNWDVPSDDVVVVDMWMSSASIGSHKFLKDFAVKRAALNEYIRFIPHYHIFSMESSQDYKELCSDVSGTYCAEDPDVGGKITGYTVLLEDIRQLCIHELYLVTTADRKAAHHFLDPSKPVPAVSSKWWDYATNLLDECPLDGTQETRTFGQACSERVMHRYGIEPEKVEACVAQTKEQKLKEQLASTAWSPRALRINGWRYSGTLDADLVTRAICAGFLETPAPCRELVEPRDPFLPLAPKATGVSFRQMIEAIVATAMLGLCLMYFYKRALTRHVHTALREEVMLEVQSEMARYKQMDS